MTYDDNKNKMNTNNNKNKDISSSIAININNNKRKSNIFISNENSNNKKFKYDNENNCSTVLKVNSFTFSLISKKKQQQQIFMILKDSNVSSPMPDIISSSIKMTPIKKDASTSTTQAQQNCEPCQPGTPILLEGIIWQETNRGIHRL